MERKRRTPGRATDPPRLEHRSPGKSCLYVSGQFLSILQCSTEGKCVLFDSLSAGGEPAAGRREAGAAPASRAGRHAAGEGSRPVLLLRRRRKTGSGSEEEHPLRREDAAACACPRRTKGGRPCHGGRPLLRRRQRGQHPQPPAVHPAHGQDTVGPGERGKKIGFPFDVAKRDCSFGGEICW